MRKLRAALTWWQDIHFHQMFKTNQRERSLSFQPSQKTDAICSLGDITLRKIDKPRIGKKKKKTFLRISIFY